MYGTVGSVQREMMANKGERPGREEAQTGCVQGVALAHASCAADFLGIEYGPGEALLHGALAQRIRTECLVYGIIS